jgi:hypothetical protein
MTDQEKAVGSVCDIPQEADYTGVTIIELEPTPPVGDYREAMEIANGVADERLGEYMLLSWYDRDRDFSSPQHVDECHANSPVPGYVDYALYRDAKLKVNIGNGRKYEVSGCRITARS